MSIQHPNAAEARLLLLNPVSAIWLQVALQSMVHDGGMPGECAACRKFRPALWKWVEAHMSKDPDAARLLVRREGGA